MHCGARQLSRAENEGLGWLEKRLCGAGDVARHAPTFAAAQRNLCAWRRRYVIRVAFDVTRAGRAAER